MSAEVDLSEGVGGGKRGGLLAEILSEHGGKNLGVEMQKIPVEFVGGHCGVGPKLGRGGESETSTQDVRNGLLTMSRTTSSCRGHEVIQAVSLR